MTIVDIAVTVITAPVDDIDIVQKGFKCGD